MLTQKALRQAQVGVSRPRRSPIPRRNASSKRLFASASRCEKPYLFCPHPAYGSSLRAQGCTHFLAPPTRTWHPRPPGHWSPAPGSTTPGPAGSGPAQTFPRWLLPSTDRGLTEIERGPISTIGLPYYSVCHRTGRPLRANQTFLGSRQLVRRTGGRRPFSEGSTTPVCSWLRTNWRAPARLLLGRTEFIPFFATPR